MRSGPCPVVGSGDLSKVKNAKGNPLPERFVEKLQARREAIRKGFKVHQCVEEEDIYPEWVDDDDAQDFLDALEAEEEDHTSQAQVCAAERQQAGLSGVRAALRDLERTK